MTLGLLAVVLPLIEGRVLGWPVWIWLCLVASMPLLLAFVAYQRWLSACGRAPLLDLTLFRERAFSTGLVTTLAFFGGMASFFLVLELYLQQGRGLSALTSGVTFSVLGLGYLVASLYAPRLARRLGHRSLTIGALAMAFGLVLLQVTVADTGLSCPIALLVPGLLLDGLGMGLVLAPLSSIVLAGLAPQHARAAAGVLATMQQIANALGVAIIGIIFYGALGHTHRLTVYSQAFGVSLIYLIALALAVSALTQLLPRSHSAR